MGHWRAIVSFALIGCTGPLAGPGASDTGGGDPDTAPVEVPTHTLDEVMAELPRALAAQFEADATPVFEAYKQIMTEEDAACPSYRATDPDVWYQIPSCTTTSGATFYGTAFTDSYGHNTGDYTASFLFMLCLVVLPDGTEFTGHGTVWQSTLTNSQGDTEATLKVEGGFRWDSPEATGWLATGEIPTLFAESRYSPDDGDRSMHFDGALVAALDGFEAATFQGVSMAVSGEGACTEEPTGTFGLRDETGNWYLLTLDGSGDSSTPGCDGCGPVTWRGQELGIGCLDFTEFMDWEQQPW